MTVMLSALVRAFFVCFLAASLASAGTINVEHWRGHVVLRLSGEITTGLSEDLSSKANLADVWADGTKVLLLDSLGGEVDEAFRISKVLDATPFHTVVPNEASCASACGSIVFVAGKFRTVEPFGRIGQHSCSRNGIPDQSCNEEITRHAVRHGVSSGSIEAFVTYTPPEKIIWFSREDIDGWGLSRYPGEEESGFEKSEPRVIKMLTGEMPLAQSAWRLDFWGDGYRAFNRTTSDAEREMQLNLFCYESLPGRLFLTMEVNGDAGVIGRAIRKVTVATESFSWDTATPYINQEDIKVSVVVMEVPKEFIKPFLTSSKQMVFNIDLQSPYVPMRATTHLARSRKNLLFAANNCAHQDYDLTGKPIPRQ